VHAAGWCSTPGLTGWSLFSNVYSLCFHIVDPVQAQGSAWAWCPQVSFPSFSVSVARPSIARPGRRIRQRGRSTRRSSEMPGLFDDLSGLANLRSQKPGTFPSQHRYCEQSHHLAPWVDQPTVATTTESCWLHFGGAAGSGVTQACSTPVPLSQSWLCYPWQPPAGSGCCCDAAGSGVRPKLTGTYPPLPLNGLWPGLAAMLPA
jgi:hypothetical protein